MKKLFKIILCLLLSGWLGGSAAFAQVVKKEDACLLYFKTWNFLKYAHPLMATGRVNADSLFLAGLPKVMTVTDRQALNTELTHVVDQFPVPPELAVDTTAAADLLTKNLDLKWFRQNPVISSANRKKLEALWQHRYIGETSYYLPALSYEAEIPHEPAYPFPKNENVPLTYRLLALAKLQGAVDELFPHKYRMTTDFDQALKKAVPAMVSANSRRQYEEILLKLTALFQDTHSFGFYKQLQFKKEIFKNGHYPPFTYHVFEDNILVTGEIIPERCAAAGIQKGDEITAINGEPVKQVVNRLAGLLPASNRPALVHRLSDYVQNLVWGADSGKFRLQVRRGKQVLHCTITFRGAAQPEELPRISRHLSAAAPKKSDSDGLILLSDSIAYFKISDTYRLIAKTPDADIDRHMDSLLTAAGNMKGIIFDMRGYPDWGGFVYTYIFKHFGSVPHFYARYYELNKQQVGTYRLKRDTATYYAPGLPVHHAPYPVKVVMMVNSETLSQSEWNTMNLQAIFPQAITIGEQTAGADGDIKQLHLPGGYTFDFTGNAIFYNNGREAQQNGVYIDRKVPVTAESLLSGKDLQLETAIQLIRRP